MAFSATSAFVDPTPAQINMGATLTASVQTASTSTIGYYALLLPVALEVFAVGWGIRKSLLSQNHFGLPCSMLAAFTYFQILRRWFIALVSLHLCLGLHNY